jgi:YHS domain-containing protein
MEFLARIFRFLFWTLVLSWGIWLLKRLFNSQVQTQAKHRQTAEGEVRNSAQLSGRRLVRDPQCGMHVAEELALPVRMGNELIHFCSMECRDRYLQQTQRLAANG